MGTASQIEGLVCEHVPNQLRTKVSVERFAMARAEVREVGENYLPKGLVPI